MDTVSNSTLDEQKLKLLRTIENMPARTMQASSDTTRFLGYRYQAAEEIFPAASENDIIVYLESLVKSGMLSTTLQDKVHLCPYTYHHDLNFREICPYCGELNIELSEMIHHYNCGYVGPEQKFLHGPKYKCPKCKDILRHIGVDYEKASDTFHCRACDETFTTPDVQCFSLYSEKSFAVEEAVLENIYSYTVTNEGRNAIEQGYIREASLETAFRDITLQLYTESFFLQQLDLEVSRAKRHSRQFTVFVMDMEDIDELRETYGHARLMDVYENLASLLMEMHRDTDIIARFSNREYYFLLPETPLEHVSVVIEKVKSGLKKLSMPFNVNFIVVNFPKSGKNSADLLELLSEGLYKARQEQISKTIIVE